jgi:hypothetical protein
MTPAEMLAVHDEFTLDDLLFENQELKERDFRSWKEYVFAQIGLGEFAVRVIMFLPQHSKPGSWWVV